MVSRFPANKHHNPTNYQLTIQLKLTQMTGNRIKAFLATGILTAASAIGAIIPADISSNPDMKLAAGFLEQYKTLTDNRSREDVAERLRRAKEDGFKYTRGSDAVFSGLTGKEDFNISFFDGTYTASWSQDGRKLVECTFPATITLLTLSNKKELDNEMISKLRQAAKKSETLTPPTPELSKLEKVSNSDFYVLDKGFYISPKLKNRVYFSVHPKISTIGTPVFDTSRYTYETLSNMMLTGCTPKPQTVHVKVDTGYNSETVDLPLSALFQTLEAEGSVPYWGVSKVDGKKVKGTYVWHNNHGGYVHVLSVEMPIDAADSKSEWNAKMHCYVRLDNIKSLFEEFPEL